MIRKIAQSCNRLLHLWRMRHNPIAYARSIGVKVGEDCRLLGLQPASFGSEPFLIKIGNHVTITSGVRFITHDGGVWVFRKDFPGIDVVAPITIGNNVFIGINAIIMPGVRIGDDCIIGAGSLVTRNIPRGQVAVGVPARPIKTIEEYWEKVKPNASHIRTLPEAEKRAYLQNSFLEELS